MAKIKFGMMMTDARGKLGGQVFSKNRGGAYVRTKVTPKNAKTARQMAIRSLLSAISQRWSALTAPQRASFNGAVDQFATTDIFGDSRNPSGKTLFTKLNLNLENSLQPAIVLAPVKVETEAVGLNAITVSIGAGTIGIADGGITVDQVAVVNATAPQSQGTSFYKGRYRQIFVGLDPVSDDAQLYTNYVAKFGVPKLGDNISFEVYCVYANGQRTLTENVKATIVA